MPNPTPHHEEADGCDHGNSQKPCKPDPQPTHGQECLTHGQHGGINEDHCDPKEETSTTSTTSTTTLPPTTTTTTAGPESGTPTSTTKPSVFTPPTTTTTPSTTISVLPSTQTVTTTSATTAAPKPLAELPHTGFDSGLGGLGVALVLIGVALRRRFGGAR